MYRYLERTDREGKTIYVFKKDTEPLGVYGSVTNKEVARNIVYILNGHLLQVQIAKDDYHKHQDAHGKQLYINALGALSRFINVQFDGMGFEDVDLMADLKQTYDHLTT